MVSTRSARLLAKRQASGSTTTSEEIVPGPNASGDRSQKSKKIRAIIDDDSKVNATAVESSDSNKKNKQQNKKTPLSVPIPQNKNNSEALLSLSQNDNDLLEATLFRRPSKRNRSPYVADILVHDNSNDKNHSHQAAKAGRQALCHVPNLDMGGKCIPGATLLVKPARDPKGKLVGPHAINPKYGTPKCEFIAQLLRVDETIWGYSPPTWVGAHPTLGEQIAEQLLLRNCFYPHSLPGRVKSVQQQVRNIAGTDMRVDFVVHFEPDNNNQPENHKPCLLEVKTVVDTDFAADRIPTDRTKCVFVSPYETGKYRRAAIFPWGESNQKGPDGEKVVSARAIKHVRELTRIAQHSNNHTKKTKKVADDNNDSAVCDYQAAILFVVIRNDAEYFRPNHEACPSFCKYLKQAHDAGVHVLAKRVDWGDTNETIGTCWEGPILDIEWPDITST